MSLNYQYIQSYNRPFAAALSENLRRQKHWTCAGVVGTVIFIRSGVYHSNDFSVSDVNVLIDSLCTW